MLSKLGNPVKPTRHLTDEMKDYHYRMVIEEAQVREQKAMEQKKKELAALKSNVMVDVLKMEIKQAK